MPLPLSLIVPAMFILSAPSYASDQAPTPKQAPTEKSASAPQAAKPALPAQKKALSGIQPIVIESGSAVDRKRAAAKAVLKDRAKAL